MSCVADGPTVAVLGATGYAGAIAAGLVYRHPWFRLAHVTARAEAGQRLDDVHPRSASRSSSCRTRSTPSRDADAALVAYPHGAAAPVVAELRGRGLRVVDLSADFRLTDRGIYEDWYGAHGAPDLFGSAVYGLPSSARAGCRTPTSSPTPAATRPPRCSRSRRSPARA